MVIVNSKTGLASDDFRGAFGLPWGFGRAIFGKTRYGDENVLSGIYAKYKNHKVTHLVRKVHYKQYKPRTTAQQAWANVFRNAVVAWRALDESEQRAYNGAKYPPALTGYNRFISRYLKDHL